MPKCDFAAAIIVEVVMATTERFVVDRDQAHRISKRIAELQRQVFLQNDTALDPERVIATLQGMTEGKLTPFSGGLRGRFIRTMSITIGGVLKDDLIEQVGRRLAKSAATPRA